MFVGFEVDAVGATCVRRRKEPAVTCTGSSFESLGLLQLGWHGFLHGVRVVQKSAHALPTVIALCVDSAEPVASHSPTKLGGRRSEKALKASLASAVDLATAMCEEMRSSAVRRSLRAD